MWLHRQFVLLPDVGVRRTSASALFLSYRTAGGMAAGPSCLHPQRSARNTDSPLDAVGAHSATFHLAGLSVASASPDDHLHQPLHHENRQRAVYGKEGLGLMERYRISGTGASLGRSRGPFSIYVFLVSAGLFYVIYYITTTAYLLTTDPSPYRSSLFFHFPCDMAVVENRWTGERHTVEVVPEAVPLSCLRLEGIEEENQAGSARVKPAIVQRRLRINSLLHRVFLYSQKTNCLVLVDVQAEMQPYRFIEGADSLGKNSRPSLGVFQKDNLLLDINNGRAGTGASKRRWWRLWGREADTSTFFPPPLVANSGDRGASSVVMSGAPTTPTRILLESRVRLRDAPNGYQKGHLSTYEQFIHHVAREKIKDRYYQRILERGMGESRGLRKVYAEELIRNGLLSGNGVTLAELVTDLHQFAEEVFSAAKAHFRDDVIVYEYTARLQ